MVSSKNEARFFQLSGAVFASLSDTDGFIGFSAGTSVEVLYEAEASARCLP